MKIIKTGLKLKELDGKDLTEGETKEPVTIGMVICNVLSGRVENPQLGYVLAKKFAIEKQVELKAEEIVFIKQELLRAPFNAIVIGQAIEILEESEKK